MIAKSSIAKCDASFQRVLQKPGLYCDASFQRVLQKVGAPLGCVLPGRIKRMLRSLRACVPRAAAPQRDAAQYFFNGLFQGASNACCVASERVCPGQLRPGGTQPIAFSTVSSRAHQTHAELPQSVCASSSRAPEGRSPVLLQQLPEGRITEGLCDRLGGPGRSRCRYLAAVIPFFSLIQCAHAGEF